MSKSLVFAFLFLGSLQLISAQINFFESMFGHHQQQQQQQQQQPLRHAYADVSCSQYLCPTLDCVALPKDCPCPNVEDIKCLIPDMAAGGKATQDATVVCTRGQNGCTEVDKLMRKGVKFQKK